jgi:hypothetical protein
MAPLHSSTGLVRVRAQFGLEMHPRTVADVQAGVHEQLNAHLIR